MLRKTKHHKKGKASHYIDDAVNHAIETLAIDSLALDQTTRSPQPERASLPETFPILRLPQELRDMVLGHILNADYREIDLSGHGSTRPDSSSDRLNVLRTCRQVNDEATHVLYLGNYFHLASFELVANLSHRKTVNAMQNVKVSFDLDHYNNPLIYQNPFIQLHKLEESQTAKNMCHIELQCFTWEPSVSNISTDIMDTLLSTYRVVKIEMRHEAGVLSMNGTDWRMGFLDSNPNYDLACELRDEWIKHRMFAYRVLKEKLTPKLGEGILEIVGVSEVLALRSTGRLESKSSLGQDRQNGVVQRNLAKQITIKLNPWHT